MNMITTESIPSNVVAFDPAPAVQSEFKSEKPSTVSHGLFKVGRKTFQRQLAAAARVPGSHNTLPVLSCVLLAFGDGRLTVEATNLDVYVSTEVPAETTGGYRIAIPIAILAKFVARCSSDYLMAEVKGVSLHISDVENRTEIVGICESAWPAAPELVAEPMFDIAGKQLVRVITETQKSASEDETRYILNGIALALGKIPEAVATDGRRLTKAVLAPDLIHVKPTTVILPSFAAEVVRSGIPQEALVNVTTNKDGNRIHFRAETQGFNYSAHARLVDGNYPNYAQVIPTGKEHTEFVANREEVLAVLGRITVLNTAKVDSVKLKFGDNVLTVSVNNTSVGNGKEEVAVKGKSAKPISIALSPIFLREILSSWTDESVTLSTKDEVSPLLVSADGKVSVIMPIRLS